MANFFSRLNPNFVLIVFAGLLVFGVYLFFDEKRRREEKAITSACAALVITTGSAAENTTTSLAFVQEVKEMKKLCEDAGGTEPFLSAVEDGYKQKEKTQ
jgi:hypothetical protein